MRMFVSSLFLVFKNAVRETSVHNLLAEDSEHSQTSNSHPSILDFYNIFCAIQLRAIDIISCWRLHSKNLLLHCVSMLQRKVSAHSCKVEGRNFSAQVKSCSWNSMISL
ncbi:MAG: hypothetical protein CTY31_11620 [Hyphomicrobium sp.]|nr:MAG: hypothetical protein CTY39_04385 [Hyphomicrobium sp.]PPC99048.1 MAG: hypothetical protein CTY31_11620 [Hyphomicrobium sp.]